MLKKVVSVSCGDGGGGDGRVGKVALLCDVGEWWCAVMVREVQESVL